LESLNKISPSAPSTAPTSTPTSSHSAPSPVDLFKRGIKRDPSYYPTLQDELWNDNWHRSFANQAREQDLIDVLNAAYVPNTSAENDLFQGKQKYMYAVLESKVNTAKGKAIIRKHESSFDAQKAYAELQSHHLTSTKASLSSVKILGYITSAKIGDGSWHGTAENFILNWKEQIRLYERLTPSSGPSQMNRNLPCFKQPTILCYLQEPRQVKAAAALLKVHTKKDLDYEAYSSLLLSTASDYDSKHGVSKVKRQVYAHDLEHDEADLYDASYEMDPFDIDTPLDTIQAFASKFTPHPGMKVKVRMPKDKWFG
jgi:hypothetical protein